MTDNKEFNIVGPRLLKLLIRALECQDDAPCSAEHKFAEIVGTLNELFPDTKFTDQGCLDTFDYYNDLYELMIGK